MRGKEGGLKQTYYIILVVLFSKNKGGEGWADSKIRIIGDGVYGGSLT